MLIPVIVAVTLVLLVVINDLKERYRRVRRSIKGQHVVVSRNNNNNNNKQEGALGAVLFIENQKYKTLIKPD
jgi:hypothetical protein